jgi:hypothetical protein
MAWIPYSEDEIRVFYTHYISHLHHHQVGSHWCVPCVIHRGDGPNLKIHRASGMWFCHSTCQNGGGILEFEVALNHSSKKDAWEHIFQIIGRSPERAFVKRVVAYYDYVDEEGRCLFQKVRYEPKSFSLRQPNPKRRPPHQLPNPKNADEWLPHIRGVRRVLYRLPEVLQAPIVCVTEGERDVHTLETLGFVATCNPGGAGK